MTGWIRTFTIGAAVATALGTAALAAPSELTIMAPAAPGGGWDQTARSMQSALQEAGIVGNVQVVNVPGAGGTIGLAQFVNDSNGDPQKLIVGGYVMVGAIIANQSPVSLAEVTPIARLTGEYDAIVVPAASDIKTLADLVAKLKADPGAVSWAGGSAGGVDHIAVGLIAKAVGVDPTKINYIPYSGGGEALAAILGGQVTAGISGLGEFEGQIASGDLRLLAVTGGDRHGGSPDPQGPGRRRRGDELADGRRPSRPERRADRRPRRHRRGAGQLGSSGRRCSPPRTGRTPSSPAPTSRPISTARSRPPPQSSRISASPSERRRALARWRAPPGPGEARHRRAPSPAGRRRRL